jgi:hypothetical protein
MNRDTPCQTRYGRTGVEAFPVGKRAAKAMNSALSYLTRPEREGKNWKAAPGAGKKNPNLLVVYLESSPEFEAAIAEMFTGGDETEASYEAVCKDLRTTARAGNERQRAAALIRFESDRSRTGSGGVERDIHGRSGSRGGGTVERGRGEASFIGSGGAAGYANAPGCRLADI